MTTVEVTPKTVAVKESYPTVDGVHGPQNQGSIGNEEGWVWKLRRKNFRRNHVGQGHIRTKSLLNVHEAATGMEC